MKNKPIILIILLLLITISTSRANIFNKDEKISLELESVSLPMVLSMIAQQYGLNLVLSGEVTGNVSVRLDSVDIKTALEAILYPNGFNYYINDDVIIVKPISVNAIGELKSEVIQLKYIAPSTAQKALEPLRSEKGNIVILDKLITSSSGDNNEKYKPNSILITDYPTIVDEMSGLIKEMDKQERLISIEVKIIETKLDNQSNLGISWPTQISAKVNSDNTTSSDGTTSSSTTVTNNATGNIDLNGGKWTWGTLTVDQLSAVLSLLKKDGRSKLVSNPHLTTLENHEAEIKITTDIPIPTVNRFTQAASTQDIMTFYDEEVGISLLVTPRINEKGKITMDVYPKVQDIIGYTGSKDAQKPITTSRSIRTRITVADGETAALGGLLKEDNIESQQKVPLLGSIPLLGKVLFTSKSKQKTTTDLIILITPHIMPKL